MKMKNNILKLFLAAAILSFGSCETFDLDQTVNPSTLEQDQLDPVYAFNYAQLTLPDFVYSANSFTQRVTRQMAMTGGNTYENAFANVNFNENWTTGYLILNTIKKMEPRAVENDQTFILGASKIIRCYVLMTMVDMYGDIPYDEALMGTENLTPRYDNSAHVYAGIYNELNEAIELLKIPTEAREGLSARDLYYGGEEGTEMPTKWITVAKSLKLKMLNNARLVGNIGDYDVTTEATALIAENDLIDNKSEDFEFKYGRNRVNPNSRHPMYNDQYEFGGGAYLGNYFIWALTQEKVSVDNAGNTTSVKDPREHYYIHKQGTVISTTSTQTVPCLDFARPPHFNLDVYNSFYSGRIGMIFCYQSQTGYLGRDHGDASGIPNDNEVRAVAGLYPIGGLFRATNASTQNSGTDGALGEGIMPMLQTSYMHFIKAELYKTILASDANAKAEFISGVNASVDKVVTFLPDYVRDAGTLADVGNATTHINFLSAFYDTLSDAGKLEMIEKEFYLASWGNGIEPYNNYRRTGYPSNFQPTFEDNPGPFYSTALYSGYSVNNNPNTPSSVRTRKVFWDVASLDLH